MTLARLDISQKTFSLTPTTLDEAIKYSKLIAESDFCPREYKGKSGNVLVAVQYGAELGLSPMQALQNIAIINGKPCVWGDALLALTMASPTFVNIKEELNNGTATCCVQRKDKEIVVRSFSIDDAKKAGLWGKQGPWTQYPNRMLQMRARTFALRDSFPDVLKGLISREEAQDYKIKTVQPVNNEVIEENKKEKIYILSDKPEVLPEDIFLSMTIDEQANLHGHIHEISESKALDELQDVYTNAYKYWIGLRNKEAITMIIKAKDEKKKLLEDTENAD